MQTAASDASEKARHAANGKDQFHRLGVPTFVLAVLIAVQPCSSCHFHCNTSLCGDTITIVNQSFYIGYDFGQFDAQGNFVGLHGGNYYYENALDLRGRNITRILDGAFSCWNFVNGSNAAILLDDNPLRTLVNGTAAGLNGVTYISLTNCSIASVTNAQLRSLPGGYITVATVERSLVLYLTHNEITTLPDPFLEGVAEYVLLDFGYNRITVIPPTFFTGYQGIAVIVDLGCNRITSLPDDLLGYGSNMGALAVNFTNNNISHVGGIFGATYVVSRFTVLQLTGNHVNATGLQTITTSYRSSQAPLQLDVQRNNITTIPPQIFTQFGPVQFAFGVTPNILLNASHNPFLVLNESMFKHVIMLSSIFIDVSHATAGPVQFPERFEFGSYTTNPFTPQSTLFFRAANTSAPLTIVTALNGFLDVPICHVSAQGERECIGGCGPGCNLTVVISYNGITSLPSNAFALAKVTSLDLSHNNISSIAGDAFNYTFFLRHLMLSSNQLTEISQSFLDNTPALEVLELQDNSIWALPMVRNHISSPVHATGNPLQCDQYGPTMTGCTCSPPLVTSEHCGYTRCLPTANGCHSNLLFNSSNCSVAPASACVNGSVVLGIQYYNEPLKSFLPLTVCESAYPTASGFGYIEAYQFATFTSTSDRLCSICSTCPSGYSRSPCTATSDSKCTRGVTPGAIAALVMAIVLVGVVSVVFYRKKEQKSRELGETKSYLELTERLLGDEREEKVRMGQAWSIAESDLTFGAVLGVGAFGRVVSGKWGHIPVAIKILLRPLDELDPGMAEDFEREVAFMRSVRHPHVLTFFGAGVNTQDQAYLVVELMTNGSLKALLRDKTNSVSWSMRLQFASDIGAGMRYLHEIGTIHRDLKADNCFVDSAMRVKVGDFGTGRIASTLQPSSKETELSADVDGRFKTLTRGTGSYLWMAPEALCGQRIAVENAPALDVYSYAIVMFEIWTRGAPWEEIIEEGVQFLQKVNELVVAGVRPAIPQTSEKAPTGYEALMTECWASMPEQRPTFAAITARLPTINCS